MCVIFRQTLDDILTKSMNFAGARTELQQLLHHGHYLAPWRHQELASKSLVRYGGIAQNSQFNGEIGGNCEFKHGCNGCKGIHVPQTARTKPFV